jgi:hypothetical protein
VLRLHIYRLWLRLESRSSLRVDLGHHLVQLCAEHALRETPLFERGIDMSSSSIVVAMRSRWRPGYPREPRSPAFVRTGGGRRASCSTSIAPRPEPEPPTPARVALQLAEPPRNAP